MIPKCHDPGSIIIPLTHTVPAIITTCPQDDKNGWPTSRGWNEERRADDIRRLLKLRSEATDEKTM